MNLRLKLIDLKEEAEYYAREMTYGKTERIRKHNAAAYEDVKADILILEDEIKKITFEEQKI